ncbi:MULTISPECIES: hypothetical protein [unclassified Streptomyces]|uniref:hypothetical protein n=1 Tax=unclassified Streptomyces TaxID=2593676 RepID=UPI00382618F4
MKVGIEVEVEEHNPAQTGFVPQAKGWIVELVRDYERQLHTAESRAYWAMTAMIWRRLTGAAAPMPDHPAHQQILAVFATADAPPSARQVCKAMDLTVAPNKINNTRLKLSSLSNAGS